MSLFSSSECNKLIRSLKEEYENVLSRQADNSKYTYSVGEEQCLPVYDFKETQSELNAINDKIAKIKHSVNVFNTNYVLPGLGFTIDTALFRMAVLNNTKRTLYGMKCGQDKVRRTSYSGVVEYTERTYNVKDVEAAYKEVEKAINDIQLAIDYANITEKIEITL